MNALEAKELLGPLWKMGLPVFPVLCEHELP
jgi:hypothetical protein